MHPGGNSAPVAAAAAPSCPLRDRTGARGPIRPPGRGRIRGPGAGGARRPSTRGSGGVASERSSRGRRRSPGRPFGRARRVDARRDRQGPGGRRVPAPRGATGTRTYRRVRIFLAERARRLHGRRPWLAFLRMRLFGAIGKLQDSVRRADLQPVDARGGKPGCPPLDVAAGGRRAARPSRRRPATGLAQPARRTGGTRGRASARPGPR